MVVVAICFETPKAIGFTQKISYLVLEHQFPMPCSWSLPDCHVKLSTSKYMVTIEVHFITMIHDDLVHPHWSLHSYCLKRNPLNGKRHHQVPPNKNISNWGPLKKNTTTKKHTILRRVQRVLSNFLRRVGSSIKFPTKLHLEIHRWPFANRFLQWHPTRRWLSTSEWCGNKNSGSEKSQGGKHGKTIPSWELTYPPPRHFSRWFSFSQGGIC